jgi:hypothetical protein
MGGKPATGGGGTSTAGAGGTSAGGTSAGGTGAGGGAAGSNSSGAGGGGSGCGCAKTVIWADNTNVSWVSGDCVSVSGKNYLYTGTKAQTYALGDCNPTAQKTWCTDMGTDYKFMACP